MILKKMVTLILVMLLMAMLFSNAVAHDIMHNAEYDLRGRVDLLQVTGSNPGSGAQRTLSIRGDGQVEKVSYIVQQSGILNINDNQGWVTAVDALNNLKVIGTVKLSAPPQLAYTTTRYLPLNDDSDEGTIDPEKAALGAEILIAATYLDTVMISSDGIDVPKNKQWVPGTVRDAYYSAVEDAQIIYDDLYADQTSVDQAVADLHEAKAIFEAHLNYGLLPETVTLAGIEGVEVPVKGVIPVSVISANDQFTGAITWAPADEPFLPETVYTATISLAPKAGFTFTDVAENFFTVTGAVSVTNRADSGEVVAVFPATEAKTYAIGDTGPSGVGVVFYTTDGGLHGLEAAPSGWHGGGEDPTKQWKNTNSATGGTLTAIGSGYANTYSQMTGEGHPAAAICRAYRSEFEGDWFLPSKDELHQMYLQKAIIGGFPNVFYWSSSEVNYANGWSQSFRTGYQDSSSSKTNGFTYRVRPIRAF